MALASLFNDLRENVSLLVERTSNENDIKQNPSKMNVSDFLMALNWCKAYSTEAEMAGDWGLNEKTVREKVRAYCWWIQVLIEIKVIFGDFHHDEMFWCSVDGVHCMIYEPRKDPSSKWYLHKSNSAALTYELAIAIRSNHLVWIRGPFPASQHDITTFRGGKKGEPKDPHALIFQIPDGKKAIGDSGLQGEPNKITTTRPEDSAEVKVFKGRVKSHQETFHSRLKSFNIISQKFHHNLSPDLKEHKRAFEAVCVACQYDIENGHGLFKV